MSLQSFGFFGFLLVVAAVYLHLPQRWQSAFLLAAINDGLDFLSSSILAFLAARSSSGVA